MLVEPSRMVPVMRWVRVAIRKTTPENSQVTSKYWPLAEKSAWLGSRHAADWRTAIGRNVLGLLNRI